MCLLFKTLSGALSKKETWFIDTSITIKKNDETNSPDFEWFSVKNNCKKLANIVHQITMLRKKIVGNQEKY